MADPGARRHHAEAVERLLRPAQQRVPLGVAPVLELDVALVRLGGAEQVDLHRVVDHEVDRDRAGSPSTGRRRRARSALRIAARSTTAGTPVKSCISTRPGMKATSPAGPGQAASARDVVVGDVARAGAAEQVLEQDPHGVREARRCRRRPGRRASRVGRGRRRRRRSRAGRARPQGRWSTWSFRRSVWLQSSHAVTTALGPGAAEDQEGSPAAPGWPGARCRPPPQLARPRRPPCARGGPPGGATTRAGGAARRRSRPGAAARDAGGRPRRPPRTRGRRCSRAASGP